MRHTRRAQIEQGFTLMELSIVLVIIGLLVGGVVAGREIIRSSEMRAAIAQINDYKAAYATFEDKLDGVPGDITNATTLWATAAGNGNGDGMITWNTEGYLAWNHLVLAGLIPGNFSGTAVANQSVLDTNVPRMRSPTKSGLSFYYLDPSNTASTVWWSAQSTGNLLIWGAPAPNAHTTLGILSSVDAVVIDQKADDGNPDSGNYQVNNNSTCTTSATSPAAYTYSNTLDQCIFAIKAQ